MTIEILTGCGCSCDPYVGCDCTTTSTSTTSTTRAPGDEPLCLKAFDIFVTIPDDPHEEYAGTYEINYEDYSSVEQYSRASCTQLWGIHENVTIVLQVNYHSWVGSYFNVLVYTPKASLEYGWAWTKGRPHVVDDAWCSGHCNGTFIGAYATSSFIHNPQGEGILYNDQNHFINNAPGDFEIPYPRTWSLYGQRMDEFSSPVFGVPVGECYLQCHHDRSYFEDPEYKPPVSVSWHLKEGIDFIPRELYPN